MSQKDRAIENLLELDDVKYVIDEHLGLWVKFEAKKITPNKDRPHGIKYSLTLHDRTNNRIMGFDNAHAIKYGAKKMFHRSKYMIIGTEIALTRADLIIMKTQKNSCKIFGKK